MDGLWVGNHTYRVSDPVSGYWENVTIAAPADEMADPVMMQEYAHRAREWVAADQASRVPKPKMTKDEQHDLGSTLKDITKSHRRHAEVGHERSW